MRVLLWSISSHLLGDMHAITSHLLWWYLYCSSFSSTLMILYYNSLVYFNNIYCSSLVTRISKLEWNNQFLRCKVNILESRPNNRPAFLVSIVYIHNASAIENKPEDDSQLRILCIHSSSLSLSTSSPFPHLCTMLQNNRIIGLFLKPAKNNI